MQTNHQTSTASRERSHNAIRQPQPEEVSFIDRFLVPAASRKEFTERVRINRQIISTLPGFIQDHAYERTTENGDTEFITVAIWASREALDSAKETVQAAYHREGFHPAAMMERLGITMDRGIYKEATAMH
nr:antibiotic biosynthesis monooxygenase [uncultured Dyadobacter sp.]